MTKVEEIKLKEVEEKLQAIFQNFQSNKGKQQTEDPK
jgi:hypothetical protein